MTSPSGKAALTIVGDVSKFAAQVTRDTNRALRQVALDMRPISDQIADGVERGAAKADGAFDKVALEARNAFRQAENASDKFWREYETDGTLSRNPFDKIEHDAERARDSMGDLDPPARASLRRIATEAQSVFSAMTDDAAEFGDGEKVVFADAAAAAKRRLGEVKDAAKEAFKFDEAERESDRFWDEWSKDLDDAEEELAKLPDSAHDAFAKIGREAKRAQTTVGASFGKLGQAIRRQLAAVLPILLTTTAYLGAAGSVAGPAAIGLIALGKAVVALGHSIAGLAPLAAFLPVLIGGLGLVVGTLKLAGPAFATAFEPITRAFVDADGNAGALAKRVQSLIAEGLQPLAKEFVRVNLPSVALGMDSVARATNRVVAGVLEWVNSAPGQLLVKNITLGTAAAMDLLAPKITAAAIAIGRLGNLGGSRGISGFAELLGRIIDRFTEWANDTSIDDVHDSLEDLSHIFDKVRDAFVVLRDVGHWLGDNVEKVKAFSTALGLVGLTAGIVSANPFAIIISAISLLITNWDRVVAVFRSASAWWTAIWAKIQANPAIQDFVAAVQAHITRLTPIFKSAWELLQKNIIPALDHLKRVILDDVVPALTAFLNAVSPLVAFFDSYFLPVIVGAIVAVVDVISGLLKIIAGVFNVFSGLLTGDWSLLWHGLAQIAGGAFDVIKAIFGVLWSVIVAQLSSGGRVVANLFGRIWTNILGPAWAAVSGFFVGIGHWFADLGRSIAGFGSKTGSAFASAWSAVVSFFAGLGHWFTSLPGLIGGFLASLPAKLGAALTAMFDAGLHAIGVGIGLLLAAVFLFPKAMSFIFTQLPGIVWGALTDLWTGAVDRTVQGVAALIGWVVGLATRIWGALSPLPGIVWAAITNAWTGAVNLTIQGIGAVIAFVSSIPPRAGAALSALGGIIGGAFTTAVAWARNAAVDGFNAVIAWIQSVPGRISALAGQMAAAGLNLIRGLMSGLGQAGNFVGDLASRITGAIKGFLNQVIGKINSGIASVDDALPGISLPRIPSLATGGLTTRAGLANLHPRELVLPLEDTRATDLLARALAEADAGLRATGVLGPDQTTMPPEVHVYIGETELTNMITVVMSERDRRLRQRVQARAGAR